MVNGVFRLIVDIKITRIINKHLKITWVINKHSYIDIIQGAIRSSGVFNRAMTKN